MKKLLFCVMALIPVFAISQEDVEITTTIEAKTIDSLDCRGKIYVRAFYEIVETVKQNGTNRADTIRSEQLIMDGECPADSFQIVAQLENNAINKQQEIQLHKSLVVK